MSTPSTPSTPNAPPFTPPASSTLNGGPVPQSDAYLFCTFSQATALIPAYRAAFLRQGLVEDASRPLAVTDYIRGGQMAMFQPPAQDPPQPGDVSIFVLTATLNGKGGLYQLADIAGNMVKRAVEPDPAQGDRVSGIPVFLALGLLEYPPGPGAAQGYYISAQQ